MEVFKIITLSLSALLLLFVNISRLSNPIKTFSKNSGIELPNDTNLLNEVRGVSAMNLCAALLIALGIFMSDVTTPSFVLACLLFIGFALGRMISMAVDGKPSKQLVQGLGFELVFGALNAVCLISILA